MIEALPIVAFAVVGVVVCAIFAYANWYLRHDTEQEYGTFDDIPFDDHP